MTTFPKEGPWAISIPGVSDVSINAGVTTALIPIPLAEAVQARGALPRDP
jgi:hypothetical protein